MANAPIIGYGQRVDTITIHMSGMTTTVSTGLFENLLEHCHARGPASTPLTPINAAP
jgi:hypothetical protein